MLDPGSMIADSPMWAFIPAPDRDDVRNFAEASEGFQKSYWRNWLMPQSGVLLRLEAENQFAIPDKHDGAVVAWVQRKYRDSHYVLRLY